MPCGSCAERRRIAEAARQKRMERRAELKAQKLEQAKASEVQPPEKTG